MCLIVLELLGMVEQYDDRHINLNLKLESSKTLKEKASLEGHIRKFAHVQNAADRKSQSHI